MAIAACITLGVIHLQITLRLRVRSRWAHLCFALSALAVAGIGAIELALLRAGVLEDYRRLMYAAEFPISLMMISLAGFTWFYFKGGRGWMLVAVIVLTLLTLAIHLAVDPPLQIRHAVSIRPAETFGGAWFILAETENGPVTAIEMVANSLLIVFVVDSSLRSWRGGNRRGAALVGGSIVFFLLVTRSYAALVEHGIVETPYFFIFPFLALLLAMGRELSLDVFRAVRLAEQLGESERQVDLAARAATLGFWKWDLRGEDLWATDSARVLFGFTPAEPLTFPIFMSRVHPEDRDPIRGAVDRCIASGEDYETEYRIQPPGAPQRWIGARGRVERNAEGEPVLMRGVVIDITERRLAQEEVDGTRKEIAHVSRVSMMGELAGSLAHELNQPLAAILSNAQAARRMLALPGTTTDDLREIVDDIIKDDKRAGEVIHRLRTLVQRREHVDVERLNLNELVRDVARLLNSELVARNVELELRLSPGQPFVRAGRVEIQQVLLNLMVNAMDAMRDVVSESRLLAVETSVLSDRALVRVSDTGPGIEEAILPSIFRPFFTTKQNGLGMGLAISRTITEAHGGTLTAENGPGAGAVFTMTLNLAEEDGR
jgi:two-component system sensor kinase FixL